MEKKYFKVLSKTSKSGIGTRMAEAGMDPKILQGIMGHSDISMTMNVYNHGSIERMQNEMKKLEKYM